MNELTAVELLDGYRAGTLSPVEVAESVLATIERREPELRALYAFDACRVRAEAKASEERWREGAPLGPLDGVPLTLKENIASAGVPTPLGTAATELVPAERDAPAAARVREAGAVLLAKTTMPDYGMLTSGLSSFHAAARNPWAPELTPGGSSAGAGAAAAAGYGPLHVGTDIGGSIRLPAGWCGVVGLKPTFGRVPVDPAYRGRVIGPMTRTVADAALLMGVLARPDPRDHLALPPAELDWTPREPSLRGLRIGLQLDAGAGLPVDPAIASAVTAAAEALAGEGAVVEPVEPFLNREMLDGLDRFWRVRAWSDISALPASRRAMVLPYIAEWAARGAELSGVETYRGYARIDEMSVATLRATERFDAVLSPVSPVPPPPFDWASPTNDPARPFEHIAFTVPYNMSGQPAVSVNWTHTDAGLPVGVQLAGRRFTDPALLGMALTLERLRPPQRRWP
ncbi:amidase [Amycolatopsis suaedae]|uniref:Amidase n=1 Tax=Amycolatopsis suaedae TaxID=2510978 RepID=A0A4Q7JAY0_9PSEU|nr:amidase [Amycolatopsis suaedae]RZQ64951.1 amidase [Amycolatopsis suaedae]